YHPLSLRMTSLKCLSKPASLRKDIGIPAPPRHSASGGDDEGIVAFTSIQHVVIGIAFQGIIANAVVKPVFIRSAAPVPDSIHLMSFEPITQGIIHAGLPTFAGGFECFDYVLIVTNRH
ncbi:MAG: hypothetical protein OXN26_17465, partial [Gammaproteobacteria bacterium]|nr:hypothetical protein [Gammaproteobacteria bacterium]